MVGMSVADQDQVDLLPAKAKLPQIGFNDRHGLPKTGIEKDMAFAGCHQKGRDAGSTDVVEITHDPERLNRLVPLGNRRKVLGGERDRAGKPGNDRKNTNHFDAMLARVPKMRLELGSSTRGARLLSVRERGERKRTTTTARPAPAGRPFVTVVLVPPPRAAARLNTNG